jgi:hypothetical protein
VSSWCSKLETFGYRAIYHVDVESNTPNQLAPFQCNPCQASGTKILIINTYMRSVIHGGIHNSMNVWEIIESVTSVTSATCKL